MLWTVMFSIKTFTCLKSTIETAERGVKFVQSQGLCQRLNLDGGTFYVSLWGIFSFFIIQCCCVSFNKKSVGSFVVAVLLYLAIFYSIFGWWDAAYAAFAF